MLPFFSYCTSCTGIRLVYPNLFLSSTEIDSVGAPILWRAPFSAKHEITRFSLASSSTPFVMTFDTEAHLQPTIGDGIKYKLQLSVQC